jgi:hypothetical protein
MHNLINIQLGALNLQVTGFDVLACTNFEEGPCIDCFAPVPTPP